MSLKLLLTSLILVVELFHTGRPYPRIVLTSILTLFCLLIRYLSTNSLRQELPRSQVLVLVRNVGHLERTHTAGNPCLSFAKVLAVDSSLCRKLEDAPLDSEPVSVLARTRCAEVKVRAMDSRNASGTDGTILLPFAGLKMAVL